MGYFEQRKLIRQHFKDYFLLPNKENFDLQQTLALLLLIFTAVDNFYMIIDVKHGFSNFKARNLGQQAACVCIDTEFFAHSVYSARRIRTCKRQTDELRELIDCPYKTEIRLRIQKTKEHEQDWVNIWFASSDYLIHQIQTAPSLAIDLSWDLEKPSVYDMQSQVYSLLFILFVPLFYFNVCLFLFCKNAHISRRHAHPEAK